MTVSSSQESELNMKSIEEAPLEEEEKKDTESEAGVSDDSGCNSNEVQAKESFNNIMFCHLISFIYHVL